MCVRCLPASESVLPSSAMVITKRATSKAVGLRPVSMMALLNGGAVLKNSTEIRASGQPNQAPGRCPGAGDDAGGPPCALTVRLFQCAGVNAQRL